jgi:streptogramin lyase
MPVIIRKLTLATLALSSLSLAGQASAADIKGQVMGGGAPIAQSTVILMQASAGEPKQLAQTKTDGNGNFAVHGTGAPGSSLYLVASGGVPAANKAAGNNPAILLLTVVGSKPPAHVVINEMTTIASVVTHAQFIVGTAIKGSPLALGIAAGNVPNFVDLQTGSYGATILDALNSAQTPTMANFATLSSVLAGCVTRVQADACSKLFAAAAPPSGGPPVDTLSSIESIAFNPSHQADKIFALLDYFYPVPKGKTMRPTPFMPYLTYSPSAWIFPLKFTGGGYSGGGKLMFDSEGNAWAGDNFIVGAQNADALWDGNLSKFAPNGKPLSPHPTGFTGGGVEGIGFGLAIDAHDNVWGTTYGTKAIVKFDKTGKPLSPPDGYNFGGQLGQMQGIIVTPKGDVWALDVEKAQVIYMPQGDPAKVQFFCQNKTGDPLKNPCKLLAPFHLAIDQQDRIWISNMLSDNVTRFPASDPSKLEYFKAGWSGSGMAVDSLGNVWIANRSGSSERGRLKLLEAMAAAKISGHEAFAKIMVDMWATQKPGYESGGSVTVFRPDGTQATFSPVFGKGIVSPWAIVVDGNDNIWIDNLATASAGIVQLCGFRTEHCPPGVHTGDAISPVGGYVGGGMQMLVDIGIGPAGDVWVTNNWQYYPADLGKVDEALSTLGAGQGVTVFYSIAKPVKTPLIGPPRQPQQAAKLNGSGLPRQQEQ